MKLLVVFAILTFSVSSKAGHFLDEALTVLMNISSGGTYSSYLEGRITEIELEGQKKLAELQLYLSQKNKAYDKDFLLHHLAIAKQAKNSYQKQKDSVGLIKSGFEEVYQNLVAEFVDEEKVLLVETAQALYDSQKQTTKAVVDQLDLNSFCQQEQKVLCDILSKYDEGSEFVLEIHEDADVALSIVVLQDLLIQITRTQIEVNVKLEKYKSMEERIEEQLKVLR